MTLRARANRVVVLLVAALAAASCGVPLEGTTQTIADENVPFELLEPAATTTSTIAPVPGSETQQQLTVPLYFVRDDRIERRLRPVPEMVGLAGRLEMLAEPLPPVASEEGFRSAVAPGSFSAEPPQLRRGVVTVDLSTDFTAVPAREQVLAFAQITYTLTDVPGIGLVEFTLEGSPMNVLDDEGTAVEGTVTEENYRDIYAS